LSVCCGLLYVCHEIVECVLWATLRLSWDCWVCCGLLLFHSLSQRRLFSF